MYKPAMLIVLDGFGEGKPDLKTNAIYAAKTPFIDSLKRKYPWTTLDAGGASVGVLPGQTGGSDVGHNTIGSGRVIRQPIKIIYDAIEDHSFFQNDQLLAAINHAKQNNSNLHLMGIGSNSYIHSYLPFLYAILDLINRQQFPGNRVFLHLMMDGRDNPPQSGIDFFRQIQDQCDIKEVGKIASMIGRFYLDRGKNWERTAKLYELLTKKDQTFKESPEDYLLESYQTGVTDEFLEPQAFGEEEILPRIADNDAVINFCYRADRQRQITQAITDPYFTNFARKNLYNLFYVGMIPYSNDLKQAKHAFEEEQAKICLAEVIDQAGLRQMHIAGREKIIFVTYNLNRCQDLKLNTETDLTAPQTKEVETFDFNPEMSAPELAKSIKTSLEQDPQDVYIINFENCDQVGHTGNFAATVQAVEAVDQALSEFLPL
ncbi:MAG TPA: 2,3-bisphosphoglycerate-independent phosphoglycerate mutase, partial [Candidatus Gracilibacteria bacterium]|nr:2,3-bisphosphoglycerate-independent phosphoglycerate mutase [Candidatus Gracilibacteria bacterium]